MSKAAHLDNARARETEPSAAAIVAPQNGQLEEKWAFWEWVGRLCVFVIVMALGCVCLVYLLATMCVSGAEKRHGSSQQ